MPRFKGKSATAQGEALVKAARSVLAQLRADRAASSKLTTRQRAAADRALARAKDAELKAQARELRAFGLYEARGDELTRGRKQRIRAAHKTLENYKRNAIFAPTTRLGKKARQQVAAVVERHGGKVTRRGVFVERSESEMRQTGTDTRLVRDRATGLWEIEQVRRGQTGSVTAHIFLDPIEALEQQEAGIKRRFDRLAAGMSGNERIRFTIGGPNGNVSRRTFRNWSDFRNYIMAYRRDPRGQASFMASLVIYVARKDGPADRQYRVPVAWADRLGRRREAHPENLYDGGLFPKSKVRRRRRSRARRPEGK